MADSTSSTKKDEISELKALVLESVLNNQPFTGSDRPLHFPDLPIVLSQPSVYLIDQDISKNIFIEKVNKPVNVIPEGTLAQIAKTTGKLIYLQFQTNELGDGIVSLDLQANIHDSPDQRKHNLTSMQMKFKKVNNEWKIIDEPRSLSS